MGLTDSLTLLTIIIALAAYVAVVRHRIIDAKRERRGDMKGLRRNSALLVIADYPLVIAGMLLAADITLRLLGQLENRSPGTLGWPILGWVNRLVSFSRPTTSGTLTGEPFPTALFWAAGILFLFTIAWMGLLHSYESLGGLKDLYGWLSGTAGGGSTALLPIAIRVETLDQAGIVVYAGEASRYYEFQNLGATNAKIRLWRKGAATHDDVPLDATRRLGVEGTKIMLISATATPAQVLCLGPVNS
jgi:hypothetical protein